MRLVALMALFALLLPLAVAFAADKVSDDQIYDNVRRKLANDGDVKGGTLQVDVKDGVVTRGGAVNRSAQKAKAEKLTRNVAGVKKVVNTITVRLPGK